MHWFKCFWTVGTQSNAGKNHFERNNKKLVFVIVFQT